MSYQVLARKWRPRTFRELVGQQHVLQALVNALDHNRLHHAYLFTGTRGVGKTTIARILAKCLNCESGVSSEPCGQCGACCEINEGRFVDLIEVDAASRTKVEDTRELLENVQYAPTRGRYKVYLIDEVHMLSNNSFNALLKTLEEPPPHVKFLLATTDPQKLPVTILSRCLQFHLKNMDPERIVGHLKFVLEQEMVPFEESALWQLGRSADGSMRDAMSLTDQAIAFGGGKVAESEVRAMLGTIDQNLVYRVLEALVSGDGAQVLQAVDELSQHAPDYSAALAELLSALHRVAIAQALPEAVDNSRGDREHILSLAQQLPAEDVQLFYQTALMGRRDLPMSPDPRSGFEMVLLRMMAFRPQGVHSVPTQALPQSQSTPQAAPASTETAPASGLQSTASPARPPSAPLVDEAPQWGNEEPQRVDIEPQRADIEPQRADIEPQRMAEQSQPAPAVAPQAMPTPPQKADVVTDVVSDGERADVPSAAVQSGTGDSEQRLQPAREDASLEAIKPISPPDTGAEVSQDFQSRSPQGRSLSAEEMASMGLQPARQIQAAEKPAASAPALQKVPLAAASPERWIEIYAGLGVGGVLQSTVSNCLLHHIEGNHWYFVLDHLHSTLYDDGHQARLSELLSQYFGQSVTAVIELGTVTAETPAACAIRIREEQYTYALQALNDDPVVQQLLQQFEGVLDAESVKPVLDA
ncbi:DNA polymerase III subunit gamma/tau [Aestuariicella hydrocarbonica]|uniref:DNA polymerase III subunit gamma/tau n=1 Tax=Pseudomaricurvus hydrocarbonicus TaxID=1470433 RepID=A0A9E5JSQ9_9GAMM|nr:DNA polymerase III subunit gamma/tau [Aestuariicella hydrocarbonica]NHO64741.1 DNA polymerase III subunit gamma/tau [Aestuariicella hydrocarbonica]